MFFALILTKTISTSWFSKFSSLIDFFVESREITSLFWPKLSSKKSSNANNEIQIIQEP